MINHYESITEFEYPNDEIIETPREESIEFVGRLLSYIITSNDPRLILASLAYACGYDLSFLLGCENTEASISRTLGVTRGAFSKSVKLVQKHFNIQYVNSGKSSTTRKTYATKNFRHVNTKLNNSKRME